MGFMRRLLLTASKAAGIYAVIAVLIVVGTRVTSDTIWVPAVVYVGPAAYFIALVTMNRSGFQTIQSATIRWVACVGTCIVLTAVSAFLVFVLGVNVHLLLGGHL
jgi:hypothetical protein